MSFCPSDTAEQHLLPCRGLDQLTSTPLVSAAVFAYVLFCCGLSEDLQEMMVSLTLLGICAAAAMATEQAQSLLSVAWDCKGKFACSALSLDQLLPTQGLSLLAAGSCKCLSAQGFECLPQAGGDRADCAPTIVSRRGVCRQPPLMLLVPGAPPRQRRARAGARAGRMLTATIRPGEKPCSAAHLHWCCKLTAPAASLRHAVSLTLRPVALCCMCACVRLKTPCASRCCCHRSVPYAATVCLLQA